MHKRAATALALGLLSPAALFMLALVVRTIVSLPVLFTSFAQQIVWWYAARMWTLWVLLLALPLAVFVSGATMLRYEKRDFTGTWRGLLGAITLAAGGILAIVVLHMLAN